MSKCLTWMFSSIPIRKRWRKPLSSTRSHIAGSLKLEGAEALSQKMTAAFEDMRHDGSWQRILASYLGLDRSRALLSGGW